MLQGERHCHCHGAAGGNRGCPLGREKMWVTPELAALSCCCPLVLWCPLSPPEGAQDRVPASPQGRGTELRSCHAQAPQALPETQPHISLLGPSCASSLFLPMLWHCTGMFTLFQSNPTAIPVPWQALEKVLGRRHCPGLEQDSRQGHPHTGVGVYGPGS